MVENIKRINNPLTIIAIFAALAEVNATVAIGLISKDLHYIFIWFIIGFPSILVILFFLTLNFNTKVMYSPSDYKDDKNFMDSIFGGYYGTKRSDEANKIISDKISKELETRIVQSIQPKLEKLEQENDIADVKKEIANIKIELKAATDKSAKELSNLSILSPELKNKMLTLYRFPAIYLPLYSIIKSKAANIQTIIEFSKNFFIPSNWEKSAMKRLFLEGIIIGDNDKFIINPLFEKELILWIDRNQIVLNEISSLYKKAAPEATTAESMTKIIENSRIIAEALQF